MTVIIGYVDKINKQSYMSCDSCMSNPVFKLTMGEGTSKIYQPAENPNFLVGVCGDPRVKQLISSFLCFPREKELELDKLVVDERFIVRNIIPMIQKILDDNLYDDNRLFRSQILLAYKDNIWSIGPGFQLIESDRPYFSIGSGGLVANGVLESMYDSNMNDLSKIVKALKISTKMSIGVEGPYSMYVTGKGRLDNETMENIMNGSLKLEPIVISSINNNYIKKVIKENTNINLLYESDEMLFMNKNGDDNIYFIDYNNTICSIKPNGDLIFNIEPFEELYDNKWNVLELNAKGKKLLESLNNIFPSLKIKPDQEEE